MSGCCQASDNVKANECGRQQTSCQGCHAYTNKQKKQISMQLHWGEFAENPDNHDKADKIQ